MGLSVAWGVGIRAGSPKADAQVSPYCDGSRGRNNLQSLLDTTPPKRVPVLWDGSAPAPSIGPFQAGHTDGKISEIPLWRDCRPARATAMLPNRPKEENHALLGLGVSRRRINCWSLWFCRCRRCCRRNCQGAVYHFPGAIPDLVVGASRAGTCCTMMESRL